MYSPWPRFLSRAGSDSPKHWHVRAVPVRKTSSWAAPAAVAQSLYRAAATLSDRTGPAGRRAIQVIQSAVTVPGRIGPSHQSTGAYGPSQSERLQAGLPPLLRLLHCTGPPQERAIGPAGHTVTISGCIMIRLTEALACAGRPSQDDFKLGGPRCCSSCTVPCCCHRTGPLGQQSNILSVTVCGHCPGSLSRAG